VPLLRFTRGPASPEEKKKETIGVLKKGLRARSGRSELAGKRGRPATDGLKGGRGR